jgi:hypothetical protein
VIDPFVFGRRLLGLGLILIFMLTFHLEHAMIVHLALLALAIVGLWLALPNLAGVSLTVGLLAAMNSGRIGGADPVQDWLYPALAVAGLTCFVVVMGRRFVAHMHATHEARWARRRHHRNMDDDAERK